MGKERRYIARREKKCWLARYEARRSLRRARAAFRLALWSSMVSLALSLDVVLPLTQLRPEPSAAARCNIWCGVAATAFSAVCLATASVALHRHAFNVRLTLNSSGRRLARIRLKLLRLRVLERSV